MNKNFFTLIFLILLTLSSSAQESPRERGLATITPETVLSPVRFLASDWLEGREMGTRGGKMAGEYLSSLFGTIGLQPNGESLVVNPDSRQKLQGAQSALHPSYFQNFQALEYIPSDQHFLSVTTIKERSKTEKIFSFQADFTMNGLSGSYKIQAPVVFAGYGYADQQAGYDDFSEIDVKGKIVVRLKGMPGEGKPESEAAMKMKAGDQDLTKVKNELARSNGALAIVEIDDDRGLTKEWSVNQNLTPGTSEQEVRSRFYEKRASLLSAQNSSIPLITVTPAVAHEILPEEKSLEELKTTAAALKNISFELPGKELTLSSQTKTQLVEARNVIGKIEGRQKDKYIVIGAHYDHLGYYDGKIWNGADDNASGVSAIVNIARGMIAAGIQPEYTLIFACWDGEERGLLGSQYFLSQFKQTENILLYLNFDMIGRDASSGIPQNKVSMIYTEAFKTVADLSKKQVREYKLDLDVNYSAVEKPVSGSDNSGFAKKNIPLYWFHTGGHPDYHQATDHTELINGKKMEEIIKLSYLTIFEFATGTKLMER